jgi:hypothetical protein
MKDVIGFGSIKDLSKGIYEEEEPPSSDFFYD